MRHLATPALLAAIALAVAIPAGAKPRGTNGKILVNTDNLETGQGQVYTVDPDGTDPRLLVSDTAAGQWSPDGTRIPILGGILDFDDGSVTDLALSTRYPDLFLPCVGWSPDGARLACDGFGLTDPSLNGIYTIRSSDGGGLQQATSAGQFGEDCPGDYSPIGTRIVFLKTGPSDFELATVKLDGSGLRKITPTPLFLNFNCGDWSPQGNEILFSAHVPDTDRSTIFVVHSDGSGMRQIPIDGCGGPFSSPTSKGCSQPTWSPDGTKIVFARFDPKAGQSDLYTVNEDGSGLSQVTNTPRIGEGLAYWGTHAVTP